MSNSKSTVEVMNECLAVLLDIEGTTTSIEFVKNVLFPLADKNASEYLNETWDSDVTKELVDALFEELRKESTEKLEDIESLTKEYKLCLLVKFIKSLIKSDKKLNPLKKLQGCIWKKAYETGQINGHMYEDVKPVLEIWKDQKLPIYIYSSGSIQAQKLIFKYSVEGDLLKYINGHFDTSIGQKIDSKSYVKIAKEIGVSPQYIVFITDLPKEAEEAAKANMKVIISKRPGTVLYNQEVIEFPSITSFEELLA